MSGMESGLGSFILEGCPIWSDIDVAVLFLDSGDPIQAALELGAELGMALSAPIDCIALDAVPVHLRYRVILSGEELVCRDAELRDRFIEDTVIMELDFRWIRDQAVKDMGES